MFGQFPIPVGLSHCLSDDVTYHTLWLLITCPYGSDPISIAQESDANSSQNSKSVLYPLSQIEIRNSISSSPVFRCQLGHLVILVALQLGVERFLLLAALGPVAGAGRRGGPLGIASRGLTAQGPAAQRGSRRPARRGRRSRPSWSWACRYKKMTISDHLRYHSFLIFSQVEVRWTPRWSFLPDPPRGVIMSFLKSSLVSRCEGGSGMAKSWSPGIFGNLLFFTNSQDFPNFDFPVKSLIYVNHNKRLFFRRSAWQTWILCMNADFVWKEAHNEI